MNHHRNSTLDVLKLLASYMVVFIHVLFYGRIGETVDALARFAVPLFFLVSGYYSYQSTPEKLKRRILHLVHLLLFAVIAYNIYDILLLLQKHNIQGIIKYLNQYLSSEKLLNLIVYNVPVHTVHAWYLLASIYVYCLLYCAAISNIPEKLIFVVSILTLLLHLFLGEVLSVFDIFLPIHYVRNFAFMGLPFFGLGMLTNKYQHKLRKVPNYAIIISIVIGVLGTLLSRYLVGKNELYIGSLFILFALVAIFIKYPNVKYPPVLLSITGCSTYIFIFHRMISFILKKLYVKWDMDYPSSFILQMIHPLVVCIISTILAYILIKLTQRKKNK